MLSKSMRCTKNCRSCNQHWSTERAQFFSMTMPDCISHHQCFRSWMNGTMKFCITCHIHLASGQLTTMSSASQQLSAEKKLPRPAEGRKCFPKVYQIPKQVFLSYRKKQTFLVGKNVLTVMVPVLINKQVFEPSYDLKFMVWSHNYFCINPVHTQ